MEVFCQLCKLSYNLLNFATVHRQTREVPQTNSWGTTEKLVRYHRKTREVPQTNSWGNAEKLVRYHSQTQEKVISCTIKICHQTINYFSRF
jgi:hypothetical protein